MKKRTPFYIAVIAFLHISILGGLWGYRYLDRQKIIITHISEGHKNLSDYPLEYENYLNPQLLALKRLEAPEKIIEGANSELEIFIKVMDWTRRQWEPPGAPDPYPLMNALDILPQMREGKNRGFCAQYVFVMGDILKALGYFALRYIELHDEKLEGHYNLEVWSNEHNKWIVFDPLFNSYYKHKGEPVSALETHDLLMQGRSGEIELVKGEFQSPEHGIHNYPDRMIGKYAHVAYGIRSDLMRHPIPLSFKERLETYLYFDDPKLTGETPPYRLKNTLRDEIISPMNQTYIEAKVAGDKVKIILSTARTTPNFGWFEISVNGGSFERVNKLIEYAPIKGESSLAFRAVNIEGIKGPVSKITIVAR